MSYPIGQFLDFGAGVSGILVSVGFRQFLRLRNLWKLICKVTDALYEATENILNRNSKITLCTSGSWMVVHQATGVRL